MATSLSSRTTRLPKQQRQGEIVDVAEALFCERGYAQTSMAEIAARLDVVEGTLYKHFENKRQLLSRVLERWYARLQEEIAREFAGIRGERERLRYLVWRHLRALAEDARMCRLIFTEVRSEPTYLRSELYRLNKRYSDMLVAVIRDGQRVGSFRANVPAELVRDLVYGGIEHHVWGYLYGGKTLRPDALADPIVDLLCGGIDAHPPAPAPEPDLAHHTQRLGDLIDRLERAVSKSSPESA